jgi:hypothetical protein
MNEGLITWEWLLLQLYHTPNQIFVLLFEFGQLKQSLTNMAKLLLLEHDLDIKRLKW